MRKERTGTETGPRHPVKEEISIQDLPADCVRVVSIAMTMRMKQKGKYMEMP